MSGATSSTCITRPKIASTSWRMDTGGAIEAMLRRFFLGRRQQAAEIADAKVGRLVEAREQRAEVVIRQAEP